MQAGIVGLIDLMEEEAVLGTKEISYTMGVEAQGDMGFGRVTSLEAVENGLISTS